MLPIRRSDEHTESDAGDRGKRAIADGGELEDLDDVDEFDDAFEDSDEGDDSSVESRVSELEMKFNDLENELADVSSTMTTVRSENEEISETVEEIEENIRELIEIYEMVTRGVNPLADDMENELVSGDGGMDLFGEDPGGSNGGGSESLDQEVLETDPESFFDDDIEAEAASGDADAPQPEGDDAPSTDEGEDPAATPDRSTDEREDTVDDGTETATEADHDEDPDRSTKATTETPSPNNSVSGEAPEPTDPPSTADGSESEDDQPEGEMVFADESPPPARNTRPATRSTPAGDTPYLEVLPETYTVELLVLNWISYLFSHMDLSGVLRDIQYYRRVNWIGDGVAEKLRQIAIEFEQNGSGHAEAEATSPTSLSHHQKSLEYIFKLRRNDVGLYDFERTNGGLPADPGRHGRPEEE